MVGEPVQQPAGQAFGSEDAFPIFKRQIGGDDRRAALVTLAEEKGRRAWLAAHFLN